MEDSHTVRPGLRAVGVVHTPSVRLDSLRVLPAHTRSLYQLTGVDALEHAHVVDPHNRSQHVVLVKQVP